MLNQGVRAFYYESKCSETDEMSLSLQSKT